MYAPGYAEPPIPMVSSYGPWAYHFGTIATTQLPSSGTFESANRVIYQPVFVPAPCVARRAWWANGSSVSASYNVSVAVYASTPGGEPGTKLWECASTAQGTASQVQFVDITDASVPAGVIWLALACSSASATIWRISQSEPQFDAPQRFYEDSITVGSLPATATPVESAASITYLFGFATTASP